MRILVCTEYISPIGGAEISLRQIIEALKARGDEVTVVTFSHETDSDYNFAPSLPLDWSLKALKSIDQFGNYDLIFSQHYYHFSSYWAAKVAKKHNIPFVLKPIGIYHELALWKDLGRWVVDQTQGKFVLRNADLILPTSIYERTELIHRGVPHQRMIIVPSGVDKIRRPSDEVLQVFRERWHLTGKKVILFVGRVEKEKGIDILLDAFEDFPVPNTTLLVVGRVEGHFIGKDLVFTGELHGIDLASAYFCADLFVLPSLAELTPLVLKEASMVGLPIVASNTGAVSEIIRDGYNGLMFENSNSQDLHWKLVQALSFPGDLGLRARNFAHEYFSSKIYVEKTLAAFDSVFKTEKPQSAM